MADSKNTDTITLLPYGDRELFHAQGQDGSWSLPLYIDWKHDKVSDRHYALVMPAVGLYTSQALTLIALLQVHDIQGRKDQWVIPRKIAETLLIKAPGITPLRYYKWPDETMPPLPAYKETKLLSETPVLETGRNGNEAFISHIASVWGIQSSVVKIVFKAIAEEAPKWMMENRQALELGFCRLVAVPFRANWKEIVAFKFRKWKLMSIFNSPQKDQREALEEAGMPAAMCSLHNIGLDHGKGHVHYTLEAIPTKKFEKAVKLVEGRRLACGRTSYVAQYEKSVEKLYHHLLDALETYLRKTAAPFAKVSACGDSSVIRFMPAITSKVKVRNTALNQIPCHIIPPASPFSVFGEEGDANLVQSSPPPLPSQMSGLLQAADDMRQLEESDGVDEQAGAEGAAGLLVRYDPEGKVSVEPVLPEPETTGWNTSGLA